jgi:hypothetical protein
MLTSENKSAKSRVDAGIGQTAPTVASTESAQPVANTQATPEVPAQAPAQANAVPANAAEQHAAPSVQPQETQQAVAQPQSAPEVSQPVAASAAPSVPAVTPRYDTMRINSRGQIMATSTQYGVNAAQVAQAQPANPAQAQKRASAFGKLFGVSKPSEPQNKVSTVNENDGQH